MATFEVFMTRFIPGEKGEKERTVTIEADTVAIEVEENVSPTLVFYKTDDDAIDGEPEEMIVAAFHEWDYVVRHDIPE